MRREEVGMRREEVRMRREEVGREGGREGEPRPIGEPTRSMLSYN